MKTYEYEPAVFLVGLIVICLIEWWTPWPWQLLFVPVGGLWGGYTTRITSFIFGRQGEQA